MISENTPPMTGHMASIARLLLIGLCALIAIGALSFAWFNSWDVPVWDDWRHINSYVKPSFEGTLSWRSFYSNHHPSPLMGVLYIGNAHLFGFHQRYLGLLSVLCAFGIGFLIDRYMLPSEFRGEGRNGIARWIQRALYACLVLVPYYPSQFSTPLMTHQLIYIFLAFWYLAFVFRLMREQQRWWVYCACGLSGVLLVCLVHRDYSIIIFMSGILAAVPALSSRSNRAAALRIEALLVSVLALGFAAFLTFRLKQTYSGREALDLSYEKLVTLPDYFSVAVTSSLIHVGELKGLIGLPATLVMCRIVGALTLVLLVAFAWKLRHSGPLVELALPIFCLCITLSAFVYRNSSGQGPWLGEMGRYNIFRPLLFVGLGLLAARTFDWTKQRSNSKPQKVLVGCLVVLFSAGVGWRATFFARGHYFMVDQRAKAHDVRQAMRLTRPARDVEMIEAYQVILPRWAVAAHSKATRLGKTYESRRVVGTLNFLRERELSVFDESFYGSEIDAALKP